MQILGSTCYSSANSFLISRPCAKRAGGAPGHCWLILQQSAWLYLLISLFKAYNEELIRSPWRLGTRLLRLLLLGSPPWDNDTCS